MLNHIQLQNLSVYRRASSGLACGQGLEGRNRKPVPYDLSASMPQPRGNGMGALNPLFGFGTGFSAVMPLDDL
jgi:hypothetical protein